MASRGLQCGSRGRSSHHPTAHKHVKIEHNVDLDAETREIHCISMITAVQRWGNSLALRIPKAFALGAHIENGTKVSLTVEGDSIVISPVRRAKLDLNVMLSQITPSNTHNEVNTGTVQGKEEW